MPILFDFFFFIFLFSFFAGVIRRSEFQPAEILKYIEKVGKVETNVKGRHSNQTFIELHSDDDFAVKLDVKWVTACTLK